MSARAVVVPRKLCQLGDAIVIDVCYEEQHSFDNTVTDHPIEEGANISDHVRPNPDKVTLHCWVSNTPLSREQKQRAVKQGSVQFQSTSADENAIGDVKGRGRQTFDRLYKLRVDGTMIKVVTTLKDYGIKGDEGMVIESLSVPRTSKNYDGLEWQVTLKQIRIVRNRQTSQRVVTKHKQAAPKKKQGQQVPKEQEKKKTLAASLADGAAQSSNADLSSFGQSFGGIAGSGF